MGIMNYDNSSLLYQCMVMSVSLSMSNIHSSTKVTHVLILSEIARFTFLWLKLTLLRIISEWHLCGFLGGWTFHSGVPTIYDVQCTYIRR